MLRGGELIDGQGVTRDRIAVDVDAIEDDALVRRPRQAVMEDRQQRGDADGERREDEGRALRQRRRAWLAPQARGDYS